MAAVGIVSLVVPDHVEFFGSMQPALGILPGAGVGRPQAAGRARGLGKRQRRGVVAGQAVRQRGIDKTDADLCLSTAGQGEKCNDRESRKLFHRWYLMHTERTKGRLFRTLS